MGKLIYDKALRTILDEKVLAEIERLRKIEVAARGLFEAFVHRGDTDVPERERAAWSNLHAALGAVEAAAGEK